MNKSSGTIAETSERSQVDPAQRPLWPGWLAILIVVGTGVVAVIGGVNLNGAPEVVNSASTAPERFSADRAEEFLRLLAADGIPHPAGSEQNRIIQQRLIKSFRQMGYEVQTQSTSHPLLYRRDDSDPEIIPLTNIMVRIAGRHHDEAVMLVAHHDSVPYGPGAGDDASAVAALMEIARMMRTSDREPARDVIFLITDGEEYGLLGARKFVEEHPWAQQVRWVINLEARGTSGPSCMFETGPNNIGLIRIFARSVRRPVSSSLFYDIYRSMPNDTDFTIFKRAGMNGYNFAFIGDVQNYHTPNDNLANLSRQSLQHHGDNASALLSALAFAPELNPATGDAVWFDFYGRMLIWWPAFWGWLPIGAAVIWGTWQGVAVWKQAPTSRQSIAFGMAQPITTLVSIGAVAIGFEWLLRTQEFIDSPWPENGGRYLLAIWLVGTATAVIIGMLSNQMRTSRHVGTLQPSWFYWFWWLVLTIAVMLVLPGGSYLWLVPLSAILVGSILDRLTGSDGCPFAMTLFAATTLLIWVPIEPLFYDAIGFRIPGLAGIRAAIVLGTVVPVLQRTPSVVRGGLFAIALIAALALTLA